MRKLWIGLVALLGACGGDAPPAQGDGAQESAEIEAGAASDPGGDPLGDPLPVVGPERTILAFGDSLFAGYNLEEDEGYPERLEAALRGRGINARVIDAAVSGDTTAAGLQRIEFVLENAGEAPDLAIVELGGNDLLRGIAPDQTRANLTGILRELQERDIPVLLMGMRAPPNMGVQFQEEFDGLYPELARQYDTALVPFFMGPVYGQDDLMQDDRIHPTASGIRAMVADTIDTVIEALPEG